MRLAHRKSSRTARALAAACVAVAATAGGLPAAQAAPAHPVAPGPVLSLIVAQRVITAQKFGKQVFFDPGVYVGAAHSPLQIDVGRQSYTSPVTVTQIIHLGGDGIRRRQLPAWVNDDWNGLRNFLHMSVRDSAGKVVLSQNLTFCPANFGAQKTGPGSPQNPLYPQDGCGAYDPFPLGEVWGIQHGWAVDPFYAVGFTKLQLGTYHVTVRINPDYVQMFHVTAPHAIGRVTVKVVKGTECCAAPAGGGPTANAAPRPLPRLAQVALLKSPPRDALPDLIPLPAWGVSVQHLRATKTLPAMDLLRFNGTVWIGGNGPLDVEAFRRNASPIMPAYQYFWHNGHLIGRVRAGTMGFSKNGLWHFQQFASYRLLNSDKKLAVNSGKVGFCIAPTDPVDMLLKDSVWNLQYFGFGGGACGSESALWVQEELQVGWGDTYAQAGLGQAFVINKVPNGTYYIETIANPEHILREISTANDVTLREIILGGTAGHRTVKVPAWHGIDPEP